MRADKKTSSKISATLKEMFEAYSKRDLQGFLAFWAPDPDTYFLGSGADERNVGLNMLAESLKRDWAQSEAAVVELGDVAVSAASAVSWFATDVTVHGVASKKKFDLTWRLTGVLERRGGKWLVVQMHLSLPSRGQAQGQSWPKLQ